MECSYCKNTPCMLLKNRMTDYEKVKLFIEILDERVSYFYFSGFVCDVNDISQVPEKIPYLFANAFTIFFAKIKVILSTRTSICQICLGRKFNQQTLLFLI